MCTDEMRGVYGLDAQNWQGPGVIMPKNRFCVTCVLGKGNGEVNLYSVAGHQ